MSAKKVQQVWYACYGSNLLEERFKCYIAGGKPTGSFRKYKGCKDKTLPSASKAIEIKAELYFAKSSKTWSGGGAAFIQPNEQNLTLGKMYLITTEQFTELVKQEIKFEGKLEPDLNLAIKNGHLITLPKTWYGKILFLGYEEEIPIFTFTNIDFLESEINAPNAHYLEKIILGLRETYFLNEEQILKYLSSKSGIKGRMNEKELKKLIEI